MLRRIRNYALFADTDQENYDAVRPRMEEYNRIMSLAFAIIASILIFVMLVLSTLQEGFIGSRPVYFFGLCFSVLQIGVSLLAKKVRQLSYVAVYMALFIFMAYGIAIATLTRPESQAVTFMVLLIFVPMIFVDRPLRMGIFLICYVILFCVMAIGTKSGEVLIVDLTDAIIFGTLSIISETVVYRAKIRGYVLERKLLILSETDQLTGLCNRNCYELKLPEYPNAYKESICCVYIDVNGLHELNNSKGHQAGDEMLCYIAEAVVKQFGRKDVFRVGGDEYVAFAVDISGDEIKKRLAELEQQITKEGYHAAIGYEYSEQKEEDINRLIVGAETRMYEDKSAYYKNHDRRARR